MQALHMPGVDVPIVEGRDMNGKLQERYQLSLVMPVGIENAHTFPLVSYQCHGCKTTRSTTQGHTPAVTGEHCLAKVHEPRHREGSVVR